jgi:hypothetical protein
MESAVREIRAAQFAYVAAGQGSSFWTARATALLTAMAADLPRLCSSATDPGLKPGSPTCTAALEDFATVQRIDASVQRYVLGDQRLLASDLVFTDLRDADQVLIAWIEETRTRQAARDDEAANTIRKTELATAGGAAVFAILVLLLLTPASGNASQGRPAADLGAAVKTSQATRLITPQQSPIESTPPNIARPVDLGSAAALCTDFARLRETAQLPALLERVAALLDAAGIIIWVDDAASGELRPALSHGYPPQALARIHAVSTGADNATAGAYRERVLRVVEGHAQGNGAIAAPLLGPDGCVGIMAAEIRGGREKDTAVQAMATIVAAQLATLVTPQPAPTKSSEVKIEN